MHTTTQPLTLYKKTVRYCVECDCLMVYITTLNVPIGTTTYQGACTGKMRVSRARVVSHDRDLFDNCRHYNSPTPTLMTVSYYDPTFKYTIGDFVVPNDGFDTALITCSNGIHGFENKYDAKNYDLSDINPVSSWKCMHFQTVTLSTPVIG